LLPQHQPRLSPTGRLFVAFAIVAVVLLVALVAIVVFGVRGDEIRLEPGAG
jgi:hypothetical protein